MPLSEVLAQQKERVSGYLGKRLVIGIGGDISLSKHPQKQSDVAMTSLDGVSFNKAYNAHIEFATSNYFCIGTRVGTLSTSVGFPYGMSSGDVVWSDAYGTHNLKSIQGTPKIKDLYFGIYGKSFLKKKGALAPIGPYFSFGMNFHNYSVDYSNLSFFAESQSIWGESQSNVFRYQDGSGKIHYNEIFIEFGRAIPFNNRLMIDFSIKSGFLLNNSNESSKNGRSTLEKYLNEETKVRLRGLYYINYSLKLVLLL